MKENILYLECRGCYFFKNDLINNISDVGNYRVGAFQMNALSCRSSASPLRYFR